MADSGAQYPQVPMTLVSTGFVTNGSQLGKTKVKESDMEAIVNKYICSPQIFLRFRELLALKVCSSVLVQDISGPDQLSLLQH